MTPRPPRTSTGSESTPSASVQLQEPVSRQYGPFTPVLDYGHISLEQFVGGDLSVVNSARVSYNTYHEEIEEGDDKLIAYLLKHKHGTPFEHNLFTFNVKLPLFVAREWIRHRIGSFNEVSMRYTKIVPEFYVPKVGDVRSRVGKPGAYTYEPAPRLRAHAYLNALENVHDMAREGYEDSIADGIAPELARLMLPVSVYTQWYWTVNARSLMGFLSLRNASTAQWEIQQYAKRVEEFFERAMPITYEAFMAAARVAP